MAGRRGSRRGWECDVEGGRGRGQREEPRGALQQQQQGRAPSKDSTAQRPSSMRIARSMHSVRSAPHAALERLHRKVNAADLQRKKGGTGRSDE